MEIMTSLIKRAFLYSWLITFALGMIILSPFILETAAEPIAILLAFILAGLGFTIPLYIFTVILMLHIKWSEK